MKVRGSLLSKIIAGIVVTGLIVILLVAILGGDDGPTRAFVARWGTALAACNTLDRVHELEAQRPVYVRQFADGTWVAVVMERSGRDGAGFDASVFHDSRGGTFFNTTHTFNGLDGLRRELDAIGAETIDDFYGKLPADGIPLRKWAP